MFPSRLTNLLPLALQFSPFTTLWGEAPPTVQLDQATVYGTTNGSVTSYLNIPFAEPPIGDLRLRLPKRIDSYNGTIDATQVGPQCIQQPHPSVPDMPVQLLGEVFAVLGASHVEYRPESEDCLNLNVLVPAGTTPDDKLPVAVFIYGGGFGSGSNSQFPGEVLVRKSIELGKPIIFAAINYRLNAFGSLGGKEVKEAGVGNIALQDQREGLRWIQKHIGAFGGDPSMVTIWGPSAGGMSVGSHLVANGGDNEGLFRAAIMAGGSLVPTGDTSEQQACFDTVAAHVGCDAAKDKLECLRGVPAENITAATALTPSFFGYKGMSALQWFPHADGTLLREPARDAALAGKVANVPLIVGGCLDEGTVVAGTAWNVTTEDEFLEYLREHFFPGAPSDDVRPLLALYPNDPAQGSPFGTGTDNQRAPMYKRLAAFQGDFLFQASRRSLLTLRSGKQPAWAFMVERRRFSGLGYRLGSRLTIAAMYMHMHMHMRVYMPQPHGNDVLTLAADEEFTDYFVQFVATLDPNGASDRTIGWPRYDPAGRRMLVIKEKDKDGEEGLAVGRDDAREEAMEAVARLSAKYPI